MSVIVRLPSSLRALAEGKSQLELEGNTVREVLANLRERNPELGTRLTTPDGEAHSFINFYANDEDIRFLEDLDTAVGDGDEVTVVPAVAGGTHLGN